jgi:hypothetical protein
MHYIFKKYCDEFAQSLKLQSLENPLIRKHVQTNTRPKIQERCFLCGSIETVAREQQARQWTGWVAITWEP